MSVTAPWVRILPCPPKFQTISMTININMNNNCWYSLNIDFSNALRKDWEWKIPDLKKSYIRSESSRMFNAEWLSYMNSIGVPINHAVLFYRTPNGDPPTAHIDINGNNHTPIHYALNWIVKGKNSEMKWYNLPDTYPDTKYSMANAPYIDWPMSELEEIDKANIQSYFTLVRTDIPHKVTTHEESRWAISIRSSVLANWNDVVSHFRSKNLLIER